MTRPPRTRAVRRRGGTEPAPTACGQQSPQAVVSEEQSA